MSVFRRLVILALFITFSTIGFCQESKSTFQKVEVLEVLHVSSYTYLFVKENDTKKWLAVPSVNAEVGEIYFYIGGMEMSDFNSTELNRTFESVLFLGSIGKNPIDKERSSFKHSSNNELQKVTKKPDIEKLTLAIKPVNGGISITKLFKNKRSYEGKIVRVKGQVVKFNPQVMGKNWIHLQDGTEYNGKFDLTLTSSVEVSVGDVITIEGMVSLDKDFGYGYFYGLIVENSILINNR